MNGQCYRNSYELLEGLTHASLHEPNPAEREKYFGLSLVHGFVTPNEGREAGKRIFHAWIETNVFVFDASSSDGRIGYKEKSTFYADYKAEVRVRYTLDDARRLKNETGLYGPWDNDGIRI